MTHFYAKATLLFTFFLILNGSLFGQYINVDTSYTPKELVKDIFVGTSCIDIDESSIKITGWNFGDGDKSYGFFDKSSSSFPLSKGILLSTGKLNDAPGPNNGINSADDSNWKGDLDLEKALGISRTTNATVLEFDFISHQTNQISFDYLFASEQYLKRNDAGNCGYTDGFAFLIKETGSSESYTNLAVIPGTNTPVSVNTVYGNGGKCTAVNPQYFDQFNPVYAPISFNGQTKIMTAQTSIKTGVKYHLKIVIADQGNGMYDSGVFLKAGSFTGTKSLGPAISLCPATSDVIDATTPDSTYKWYKDGEEIIGETNAKLVVSSPGYYEVEITQKSGCMLKGFMHVSLQQEPVISQNIFSICDDDLDGNVQVNLQDYTDRIVEDYYAAHQVKYFETEQEAKDNLTIGISSFTLDQTQNSKTVYIRVQIGNCTPVIKPITFALNNLSRANPILPIEICDSDLSNSQEINLSDYINSLVTNPEGIPTFYLTEVDAKSRKNAISFTQILRSDQTFWMRFKQTGLCENVTPVQFIFKQPKSSSVLVNQTICKGTTTTLDAGPGFDSYRWLHNGSTSSSITNVTAGTYQVELGFNGCIYVQEVNVLEFEDPIITSIDIQASTVTINVSGGTPPYQYSLDGGPYQNSNVFTNVTLGNHTVYVQSGGCTPISMNFSLIKVTNFISPNGDGINDVFDLSELKNKTNPSVLIFDRFGKIIFSGSEANNFIWNGKHNEIKLPTGSYWYKIEWTEPHTTKKVTITESILLKNN
ncbi:choice-of-anchor L domain-containing protein [Empedobacter brevis]|uniref:choice-of-anchor L domain-containing protein n=1 Tax=Empedobacter brevis TaxID=247 RepID=UPI0028D17901|nr:choice-of-anchor L domain-containing protein [Empedobacter brevis]